MTIHKLSLCLLLLLLFLVQVLHAQKKDQLTGKLTDSTGKNPIASATVTLFDRSDTSVLNYSLTDQQGLFRFTKLPTDKSILLVVSASGYAEWKKSFEPGTITNTDLGEIRLQPAVTELSEVIVTASKIPIIIRNDTIEFNAAAFKTLPTAMLEDLLRKFPGVAVDGNGSVTVNGKKVNRITIEGKQFFGEDLALALKNLPANVIDKVQVSIDERERVRNPDKPKSQMGQVMNLKFKKEIKKGEFGNLNGSLGTNNLYSIGSNLNVFRDTLQMSFIGESGNARSNATNIINAGSGLSQISTVGTNINTVIRKTDFNFSYYFNQRKNRNGENSTTSQFINDNLLFTRSGNEAKSRDYSHGFGTTLKLKPWKKATVEYRPGITFSQTRQDGTHTSMTEKNGQLLNSGQSISYSRTGNLQFSQEITYEQQFDKKDRSLWANISFNHDERKDSTRTNAGNIFYDPPSVTDINQLRDQKYNMQRFNFQATYSDPLSKKWRYIVSANANSVQATDYISTSDFDPVTGTYSIPNEIFSNGINSTELSSNTTGKIWYAAHKISFGPGVRIRSFNQRNRSLKNTTVRQNLLFVLPSMNISWRGIEFNYSINVREPSLGDLQPAINNTNPLFITLGNPALRPSKTHYFSLEKNKYYEMSRIFSSYNARVFRSLNMVVRTRTIDANGVQTSFPVNIDGAWNYSAFGFIRKEYIKHDRYKIALAASMNTQYFNTPFLLNGVTGFARSSSLAPGIQFGLEMGEKLSFDQHYQLNWSNTSYRNKLYPEQSITRHLTMTRISFQFPKNLSWESSLYWSYNPVIAPGFKKSAAQWNAGLGWSFLKGKKGQINISANDLLNQNVAVRRTVTENYTQDTEYLILRRYVLIGFRYTFRNMKGME